MKKQPPTPDPSPRARSAGRARPCSAKGVGGGGLASPLTEALLAWYDRHRRVLPWRSPPGAAADPYAVWLSEIMLQQTTVKTVAPYFARFMAAFPTIAHLAAAELDAVLRLWAGLGYYARARNLHACARAVVERHGGVFPRTVDELRALPGVGAYTANAIAAIAFDVPVVPIDGNVERVLTRVHAVKEMLPKAKPRLKALADALEPGARAGDFAQALMDLGATLCTPKSPACVLCPWQDPCEARRRGEPEAFPVKARKREGELRRGAAFVAVRSDGAVLVQTRNSEGLLGGMTEVPTTGWAPIDAPTAPYGAPRFETPDGSERRLRWRRVPGMVGHVFTHFPLELTVFVADIPDGLTPPFGTRWVAREKLASEALPKVFRKVIEHALAAFEGAEKPSEPKSPRPRRP